MDGKNGHSIYGYGSSGLTKPEYGRVTRKGDVLYYHIFENTIDPLPLFGLWWEQVRSIRRLADGSEVRLSNSWVHNGYPDLLDENAGPSVLDRGPCTLNEKNPAVSHVIRLFRYRFLEQLKVRCFLFGPQHDPYHAADRQQAIITSAQKLDKRSRPVSVSFSSKYFT